MKPARLELHIEELILHGFAASDRYRIGEAVERELSRLFAEQGIPASLIAGLDSPHLDAGAFQVAASSTPSTTGAQLAQALYGGLKR